MEAKIIRTSVLANITENRIQLEIHFGKPENFGDQQSSLVRGESISLSQSPHLYSLTQQEAQKMLENLHQNIELLKST